jgi:hypothetical protein
MKTQRVLHIVVLMMIVIPCQAQSFIKKIFTRVPYDSAYVDSYYDDYLHVTLLSLRQNHQISVSNAENSKSYSYRPNSVFRWGIGLDYRFLSIEYSSQIDAFHKPDSRKGFTELTSLRLGVTGRRILASMLVQDIKGMYLNNVLDFNPNWNVNTDNYPRRRDMHSVAYLGSMYYFFNHERYSTMASLWQIDRQKISAGSFLVGITASYQSIDADTAIGPQATINSSGAAILSDKVFQYGISTGYAHNFIARKLFFINMMIIPGINVQHGEEKYTDGTHDEYTARLGFHGDVRLTAGYNGPTYYSGIMYTNYFLSSSLKTNVDVNFSHEFIRIFAGRRFDIRRKKK